MILQETFAKKCEAARTFVCARRIEARGESVAHSGHAFFWFCWPVFFACAFPVATRALGGGFSPADQRGRSQADCRDGRPGTPGFFTNYG